MKYGCFAMRSILYWISVLLHIDHIDGSMQDCSNSIANVMELVQSFTEPSICNYVYDGSNKLLLCVQSSIEILSLE